MTRALVLLGLAWLAPPAAAIAQSLSLAGGVATVTTVAPDGSGARQDDGVLVTIEGRLRRRHLSLGAALTEGRIGPGTAQRDYVDGRLSLGYIVLDGLELRLGPVARVLIDDNVVTRWVHWQAGAEFSTPLPGSPFAAHLSGWAAAGSRSGLPRAHGPAAGGVVGLRWRRGRVGTRLEYGLEEMRFSGPERLTVERLTLHVELMRGSGVDDASFQ